MEEQKLWERRRTNFKCAGCGDKLKMIKDDMCTACDDTHPKRDEIKAHFKEIDKLIEKKLEKKVEDETKNRVIQ